MKKRQVAKSDFTFAQLPHTRREVFFDCLKLRFGTIVLCGLMLLLFALPLLSVYAVRDVVLLSVYRSLADGAVGEAQAALYAGQMHFYASLAAVAGWSVFSVGLAGVSRVIRQLIWGEPIFFRTDFRKGVRQSAGTYAAVAAVSSGVWCLYALCDAFFTVPAPVACLPLGILLFALIPVALYMLSQSTVYRVGFARSAANGLAFYLRNIWQSLLFTLLAAAVCLFGLLPFTVAKYLGVALLIMLAVPLFWMAWLLYSNRVFDVFINRDSFPEYFDKGVYRMDSK